MDVKTILSVLQKKELKTIAKEDFNKTLHQVIKKARTDKTFLEELRHACLNYYKNNIYFQRIPNKHFLYRDNHLIISCESEIESITSHQSTFIRYNATICNGEIISYDWDIPKTLIRKDAIKAFAIFSHHPFNYFRTGEVDKLERLITNYHRFDYHDYKYIDFEESKTKHFVYFSIRPFDEFVFTAGIRNGKIVSLGMQQIPMNYYHVFNLQEIEIYILEKSPFRVYKLVHDV